jgi:hypothetical protein
MSTFVKNFFADLESISPKFYEQFLRQYSWVKNIINLNVNTKTLRMKLLYKKAACKMLAKLTTKGKKFFFYNVSKFIHKETISNT